MPDDRYLRACPSSEDKLEDQNVYAYKARERTLSQCIFGSTLMSHLPHMHTAGAMNDYDDTVWKCQSFLLRELPGTAKQQTFAIQVPLPTIFHGWTNEGRCILMMLPPQLVWHVLTG